MSLAHKCDRCGALYEEAPGQLSIESLHVSTGKTDDKGTRLCDSWADIDFCSKCSVDVLAAIDTAIEK